MNSHLVMRLYALILLVIFGGVVVHAPLSVWLGTLLPDAELIIKAWKETLMVPAALMAAWLVWRQQKWSQLAKDRILQVMALYTTLHLLAAATLLSGVEATLAGLAIDLRYVVFFMLLYTLMLLAPEHRRRFIQVGVAGAVVVVGFGVMQLFLPIDILSHIGYSESTIKPYQTVDNNYNYIRINSTMRGPNPLGAYTVVVLGLLAAAVARNKLNLANKKLLIGHTIAVVASVTVLWVSYSRGALGAAAVSVGLVAAMAVRHLVSYRTWVIGAVVLFALVGGVVAGRDHSVISNIVFHQNQVGGSEVTSDDDRLDSLTEGVSRMIRQPIGGGVGSTGSASLLTDSPLVLENQYLFIAHEVGWLGLGLFMTILGLLFTGLWHRRDDWLALGVLASGVGLSLVGLVLPVWADDTISIVWWGLVAVAIGSGGVNVRQPANKKTA